MDAITASAMYPYISHLLSEAERREADDAVFDMEARARGYVPERTGRYFVSDLFPEDGVQCLTCKEWVAADNYCGNCGVRLVN